MRHNKTLLLLITFGCLGLGGGAGYLLGLENFRTQLTEIKKSHRQQQLEQKRSQQLERHVLSQLSHQWQKEAEQQSTKLLSCQTSLSQAAQLNKKRADKETERLTLVKQRLEQDIATQKATLEKLKDDLNQQVTLKEVAFVKFQTNYRRQIELTKKITETRASLKRLDAQLATLSAQCKIYLEGRSWDVDSQACQQEKMAKANHAKTQALLSTYQNELNQLSALSSANEVHE